MSDRIDRAPLPAAQDDNRLIKSRPLRQDTYE